MYIFNNMTRLLRSLADLYFYTPKRKIKIALKSNILLVLLLIFKRFIFMLNFKIILLFIFH